MFSRKKRGQITIFVIVGVILLLALISVIFMRSEELNIDDAVVIPPELLSVKNYMDYCMDSASEDAFFYLGRQSGFINIPIESSTNPGRRISFGNGAEMVPFWYYENRNWIPSFDFMEQELITYINRNFMACINDMDYPANGFKLKTSRTNASTKVSINEKDISVEITYPVEISTFDGSIKTKVSRFYEVYDIKLKDMFDLAKYMLKYENTNYFLENLTIGLISIDDNIPLTGMILECGTDKWDIRDIKRSLQSSLADTFQEVRVDGTDYYPFLADEDVYEEYRQYAQSLKEAYETVTLVDNFDEPSDYENALNDAAGAVEPKAELPGDSYYYFHYFMPMLESNTKKYENFAVDFQYLPEYGMDIQANPSSDGILSSNSIEGFQKYLSILCINMYHFVYDVTYPVIVNIHDPDALDGKGYSFRYAFPVIIRSNQGDRSRQHMSFIPSSKTPDLFCQEQPSRKGYVRVYDRHSTGKSPVIGANVSMVCANKKCPLGVTKSVGGDILARVNITSTCSNPYIVAEKEGYLAGTYLIESDSEESIDVNMIKLKNYTLILKKHTMNPVTGTLGPAESVSSGSVSIYLSSMIKHSSYSKSVIVTPGDNIIQLPIASAEYDLSITYLRNNEDYSGGYYTIWDVNEAEMFGKNTITFHFAEVLPSTLDEDAALSIAMINNATSTQLIPQLS